MDPADRTHAGPRGDDQPVEAALERMAEIARALADADDLDTTLQRIVDLGCAFLDGCHGTSLTFVRGRDVSTPVYSAVLARDADRAQYDVGEGPCLDSIRHHATVVVEDFRTEERWPRFTARVLELGARSLASFRLFVEEEGEDETFGALNFYATRPSAFGPHDRAIGLVFASHASVALKAAITQAGLEAAIRSRDVIGQAKGILMEREGLTGPDAFARLRELSQRRNVKLHVLAEEIARTGELPPD